MTIFADDKVSSDKKAMYRGSRSFVVFCGVYRTAFHSKPNHIISCHNLV